MEETLNTPYVKECDENGKLVPITGYPTIGSNRQRRRERIQKDRFCGESKNDHLTVIGSSGKYRRRRQLIKLKNGKFKTIGHYDLLNMRVEKN